MPTDEMQNQNIENEEIKQDIKRPNNEIVKEEEKEKPKEIEETNNEDKGVGQKAPEISSKKRKKGKKHHKSAQTQEESKPQSDVKEQSQEIKETIETKPEQTKVEANLIVEVKEAKEARDSETSKDRAKEEPMEIEEIKDKPKEEPNEEETKDKPKEEPKETEEIKDTPKEEPKIAEEVKEQKEEGTKKHKKGKKGHKKQSGPIETKSEIKEDSTPSTIQSQEIPQNKVEEEPKKDPEIQPTEIPQQKEEIIKSEETPKEKEIAETPKEQGSKKNKKKGKKAHKNIPQQISKKEEKVEDKPKEEEKPKEEIHEEEITVEQNIISLEDEKDKDQDQKGNIKLKSKKKLIKKGKDEDAGDKDGKEENVIIEEKKEDKKSEPVEEEIIIEEIISQEDENRPTLTKKILKKGNKLIQKTFQTIPNKSPETQTIVEELIIIDGDEVKNKNVIKRTISNKNRVIEQILEKADNDEKIISQNETTTKSKQKKGITRIKEEPIIFNPESQNKNNIIKYTINKNEVLEEQFELNDKDQTKNKISEKKYPLNQYLKDILTSLGIETNYEIVEEKPKEEEKIVIKGKSKKLISHGSGKEEQKEEDKKEEEKDEDKKDKDDGSKRAKKTEERIRWIDNTDFMDERSSDKVTLPHKWRTHPRLYGKDSRYCRICRNTHGLIRKYGLNICRKCFRERAHLIGFKQTK